MKKVLLITGCMMVMYVLLTANTCGAPGEARESPAAAQAAGDVCLYVVKAENDRVAVFVNNEVFLRTDTLVSALPKSDRTKLEQGITVFSEKELKELLEDYCS